MKRGVLQARTEACFEIVCGVFWERLERMMDKRASVGKNSCYDDVDVERRVRK